MSIVIIGAGIIGVSTAYHLQELECKENIHLIEVTTEPFCGASGYAAGFVASNWYSSAVLPLGKLSFSLHKNIAEKHNGRDKWGYSGSTGVSLGAPVDPDSPDDTAEHEGGEDWLLQGTSRAQVAERNKGHTKQIDYKPSWLRVGKRQECELLSTEESTAQVDPLRMCRFLLSKVEERGGHLHSGCTPVRLVRNGKGKLEGIELDNGEIVSCTKIVFTSGPWTPQAFGSLFPKSTSMQRKVSNIHSLAGHSITVRSSQLRKASEEGRIPEGCHAVFATTFSSSSGVTGSKSFAPEIFSRLPDEIYVAGLNSSTAPLPNKADQSVINDEDIEVLKEVARKILRLSDDESEAMEIVRTGHCFRPATNSGRPYISEISTRSLAEDIAFEDGAGAWLSAGHGPWGISLSQGTGRVLAEMVLRFKPSIDVRPYAL